jgi:hypothetical protein
VTTTLVHPQAAANSQEGRGVVQLSSPSSPISSSARTNARSNTEGYARQLNIPPVDSEGIKKLYTEFKNKKTPVDIIAEHGFPQQLLKWNIKGF